MASTLAKESSPIGNFAKPHRLPLRWIFAGLLFLASILNYVDRQALSILATTIQRDLGISDSGYATVLQCFLFFYTIMYLISGRIVDRVGTRLSETLFILWWSLANMLTALVRSPVSLALVRSLLGAGEPGNFTASAKAVAEWFHPKEKGIAVGLYSMGGTIGAAIAAPLVAFLALRYGWRSAFVATGAAGFLLALAWFLLYRTPSLHPGLSAEELGALPSDGLLDPSGGQKASIPWRTLFVLRPVWLILLSRMFTDPLWYFYLFWFPKYLQDSRGFTLSDVGSTLWAVFVAADCGCLIGGGLSSYWIRRGCPPVTARLRVMGAAAGILAFSFLLPMLPGRLPPLAAASLFALAHMAWMTNATTLTIDIFGVTQVGSVQGIVGAGSSLGGFLSSGLVGWVVTHSSYAPLFSGMSILHPAALLLLVVFLPGAVRGLAPQPSSLQPLSQ